MNTERKNLRIFANRFEERTLALSNEFRRTIDSLSISPATAIKSHNVVSLCTLDRSASQSLISREGKNTSVRDLPPLPLFPLMVLSGGSRSLLDTSRSARSDDVLKLDRLQRLTAVILEFPLPFDRISHDD